MKRKIAACFLAGVLGMTGIPVPAAATQTVSSKNTVSSVKAADPLTAIQEQASAMDAQEQLEEEEEMPAQDPDPLVLDNGNVVPASQASWVKEEGDETAAVFDTRNDFFLTELRKKRKLWRSLSCLLRRNQKLPGEKASLPEHSRRLSAQFCQAAAHSFRPPPVRRDKR